MIDCSMMMMMTMTMMVGEIAVCNTGILIDGEMTINIRF
jgi:hypothetical protein